MVLSRIYSTPRLSTVTEYECVGGPLDGRRLEMSPEDAEQHLIEMRGWAYLPEGERLVWQKLSNRR